MQQLHEQIQQRREEAQVQDEMKEMEKQHCRKAQERRDMEDLQVQTQGGDTAHQTETEIWKS